MDGCAPKYDGWAEVEGDAAGSSQRTWNVELEKAGLEAFWEPPPLVVKPNAEPLGFLALDPLGRPRGLGTG